MWRFILVSFAFLGWAFYELSGGSGYAPRPNSIQARALIDDVRPQARPVRNNVLQVSAPDPAPQAGLTLAAARDAPLTLPEIARATPEPEAADPATAPGLRRVNSSVVTLRQGPGPAYERVDSLFYGTELRVLADPGEGWVRLRVVGTGQEGWLAADLLSGGE